MSEEGSGSIHSTQMTEGAMNCAPTEGYCVTCSDEALPARVLSVDAEVRLALVTLKDRTEEIDITFVDSVVPGDMLLVHGGVAIGHTIDDEANDE